jgi:hypothetical protein
MNRARWLAFPLVAAMVLIAGCAAVNLASGMAQNAEYQKKLRIPAAYDRLAGKEVAVLVNTNMTMMYEHPYLAERIALGVASGIQQHDQDLIPGVKVIDPQKTLRWQYSTPGWTMLSYADVANTLGAERVIFVDVYEYRLNPPGNRYEWEGVCAARVRIIEAAPDALDPETPRAEFDVIAHYPLNLMLPAEAANGQAIEAGLLIAFIQKTAWLFYEHEEPKYPDKYRPELDVDS